MSVGLVRWKALDVLRAIAVTAVLVEHAPFRFSGIAGWTGVDLFFVLSGFLVSGLLFAEHRARGHLRVGRFLIRRALKIYPAFYALLALTVLVRLAHAHQVSLAAALSEGLFVQNYGPRFWMHTWSLAVEEHFYLLLPVGLLWLTRRGGSDVFRPLPLIFLGLAVLLLAGRTAAVLVWRLPFEQVMYPTHFRIDALMCGVTIAYFFHYRRSSLDVALSQPRVRRGLVAVAVVCLLPVVTIPPDAPFILTAGLSLAYLGYAAILLLTLPGGSPPTERDGWLGAVWNAAAYIGRYSYSIYIWHVPILLWVVVPILGSRLPLWQQGFGPVVPAFVAVCICGGIAMGKLIEMPTLALRDRRFPRTAVAVPALPSVAVPALPSVEELPCETSAGPGGTRG